MLATVESYKDRRSPHPPRRSFFCVCKVVLVFVCNQPLIPVRRIVPSSPDLVVQGTTELRHDGVLGSTHGPGPMLIISTDALWHLLEQALRREAACTAGSWYVPRANGDKPQNAVPTSRARRPERAQMLALTGRRRAPGALAPQEDDPGR